MSAISFPLRVNDRGRLERGDRVDGLLQVLRAMVGTPSRSWSHAPWFGLHEAFLEANPALQDHPRLADNLNTALRELGIDWARVDAVSFQREAPRMEDRRFQVTLAFHDGGFAHGDL